ncbi:hypothetical protein HYN59_02255 [Flavobacterium album]|uniref:Zinc-ribbon 15 domain-containing protein n=1 Tax=Flavobacterium album TaxID=2175091 RepID=A0A2S1QUE1_9FLAO|nr:hypothetical protein [Flavobacterium album]AWH84004.1 hypothetical protein HYN59_02255 [Flavobacterium album]
MIIFGTRARKIAELKINTTCTNCQTDDSLEMDLYQRYGHIWYIPFVPSGRTAVSHCGNCNTVEQEPYFPAGYKSEFFRLKDTVKTPWWTYSGLGLLVALIIVMFIVIANDNAQDAEYIAKPKKGDIYEIKLNDSQYTLYKVDRVEGNMVFLFENEFLVDDESGIYKLKDKPFYKESYPVGLTNLKHMLDVGEILEVERDE